MLKGLKDLVIEAIDKGSTSIEDVHKSIAALPFEKLAKIGPLADTANGLKDLQTQSIGKVYDVMRTMNQQVSEIADSILEKLEKEEGKEKDAERPKSKVAAKPKPTGAKKPKPTGAKKPKPTGAKKSKSKSAK